MDKLDLTLEPFYGKEWFPNKDGYLVRRWVHPIAIIQEEAGMYSS